MVMADGQVTLGSQVIKPNVKKVRRLQGGVVGGFAGATADAFTLFERLEMKLEEHPGQLTRAAVELAELVPEVDPVDVADELAVVVADDACVDDTDVVADVVPVDVADDAAVACS